MVRWFFIFYHQPKVKIEIRGFGVLGIKKLKLSRYIIDVIVVRWWFCNCEIFHYELRKG